MRIEKILEKEKKVMDIFWDTPQPLSTRDVLKICDNTISLSRLHDIISALEKKGFIEAYGRKETASRPAVMYKAKISKEKYYSDLIEEQNFQNDALAEIGITLVRKATKTTELGMREKLIDELKAMIAEYEKEE